MPKVPSTAALWPLLDLKQTTQQQHEFFAASCASNPSVFPNERAWSSHQALVQHRLLGVPWGHTAPRSPARQVCRERCPHRMSGSAPAWHHHFGHFFYKSAFKYFLFCNTLFYIEFIGGDIWLIKFFFNFVAQKKSL